ncbi:hypothetical protein [Nocardia terpenica]|uniref:Uncharacterized protein n=1 Tax=Nocardia terpenica TaxID=455432 RepID=A0A6G9Z6Z7_9NOCA|nr:hypothetical protein [Nocardia terpenica]QIS21127.1 hypothetical protein F6W96_25190 [Nocardia terpenica]
MGRNPVTLTEQANLTVCPPAPFHFDTTTSKPSTLPDPTTAHEPGVHWQTVRWNEQILGIRLNDNGTREDPKLGITVFAERVLPPAVVESIGFELRWRYDLDTDLSWFCRHFAADPALSGPIERIGGMRVSCAFSLYEWVSVLALLQMATAGRISAIQTFHHYDAFDVVPPWETKLYSRLLYDTETVPAEHILTDMTARYGRWRALAGAYLLEDLFLRHQRDPIDWLAAEIRM